MAFINDADRFQKLASGFNSYVIAIGLTIGGAWAYHTFEAELRVQNASAQLEKLKRDLQQEPRLEIELDVQQIKTNSRSNRVLVGKLSVKNVGTGPALLNMGTGENPSLHLYEVTWADGHEDWRPIVSFNLPLDKGEFISQLIVPSGMTNQAQFAVTLRRPGFYAILLKTPRSETEIERAKGMGTTAPKIYWRASRYFWVH